MIDLKVLAKSGLTNERLKAIFTDIGPVGLTTPKAPKKKKLSKAQAASMAADNDTTDTLGDTPRNPDLTLSSLEMLPDNPTDWDIRRYWERRLTSRITDGLYRNAENFNKWAAIDLAYASTPIHPLSLPLMRVAQGYIDLKSCQKEIAALSGHSREALFEKDAQGQLTGIKAPQLVEVSHNLVHSLVTRRVAAISTEIDQQYPLMTYDTFSNAQEGKLVGDVMTQIGEQMAGAYGYRHDAEESIRAASLYSQSIKFKANAWHKEQQTLPVKPKAAAPTGADGLGQPAEPEYKRQVIREGVVFTIPHPSRVYADIAAPMARLNYDTGPQYIGHWEVVRIGDLRANPAYFNKDAVFYDAVIYKFFAAQFAYFSQYFPDRMIPPIPPSGTAGAMSLTNDRVAQVGAYASLRYDMSTTIAYHYECIIPKDVGFGTYEDPVWIRFVVAGNKAVIYAEIVGSMPASINAYNTSDNLLLSPSFAMQVLPYQEQITNLLTQLLRIQYQGFCRIWALNVHGMNKEDVEKVEHALQYPDYTSAKDIILKYDAALLIDRGQDPRTITTKIEEIKIETRDKVTEIFQSIIQLLSIAERLLFFSPQELGQVSPRTITAFEAKMVNTTTLGIRDFALVGIKQQLDADKRIIHDSYMAFGEEDLEVPVAERYDPAVVKKAGFEVVDDGTGNPDGLFTIRGKKLGLLYNYVYTTRNTDDLPAEAAEAQALSQIYETIAKDPTLSAIMSVQDKIDLANNMFRHISGEDFRITASPEQIANFEAAQKQQQAAGPQGAQGGQGASTQMQQVTAALQEITQQMQQIAQQNETNQQSISALGQGLARLAGSVASKGLPNPPAGQRALPPGITTAGLVNPKLPVGSVRAPVTAAPPAPVGV